jgi:hypothetical protein
MMGEKYISRTEDGEHPLDAAVGAETAKRMPE